MSDPLSVAGTAVGITSLGIQVCQSLIKYLRAVRGRKQELRDGISEIEQVVSLLYSLNSLLPKIGPETDVAALRSYLNSCYAKLETLQEVLSELDDTKHSSKVTRRAANAMRSVTHPFQQEKLTAIRQSLRSVLDDLNLTISIISLDSEATIQSTVRSISLDLKAHVSTHASDISDLQVQIDSNFVQLRSLQSTISGTLDDIAEQLHQTQLYIQDVDQRVDGKLTIIKSGTQSIQDSNQVTAAKLEEITQLLVSHSTLIDNMGLQINGIRGLSNTGFATVEQDKSLEDRFSGTLHTRPNNTRHWRGCHCASNLPRSGASFSFWNLRFEFEQQEHHHPSCKLWGTKKGMKRTAKATFLLKLAWLSARTTLACFEYVSGTSRPSLSIRCRNVVHKTNSPVWELFKSFSADVRDGCTTKQLIHKIELLERNVLTLYTEGRAAPGDVDEYGYTHAEMMFGITGKSPFFILVNRYLEDEALTHAFISSLRTLLQAYNGDNRFLSFSEDLAFSLHVHLNIFKHETAATNYLFSFMSQECCFGFPPYVIEVISEREPLESLKTVIREASELSPIAKAILSRRIEDLVLCVTHDSKCALENISGMDVLFLSVAWPEGLEYLITTAANTLIDGSGYELSSGERTPVLRAIQLDQTRSAHALLEAGCCLDTDSAHPWRRLYISDRMVKIIASHMAERRARLLRVAQQQLGLFSEQTSVAFADSVAAQICAALDEVGVPLHPSLRVVPHYQSIYLQDFIPLSTFYHFWEKGFHHFRGYDRVGLTPVMRRQYRWTGLLHSPNFIGRIEIICWLAGKGFMQERGSDPLDLGLNVCATGYHYLGALFAQHAVQNKFPYPDKLCQILEEPPIKQAQEDDCTCWCNAEGHGCSPTKLFLITCIHDVAAIDTYCKHTVLHHELFDSMSENDQLSPWSREALRLLTFEALEMTHTCCSFDRLDVHDHRGLIDEETFNDRGIFCCDPATVLHIRSCAEETSRATLLKELMVEFTEQLERITAGPHAFEVFIYTYWRRRMSGLYEPNSNAVEGILEHQTFQGFGISSTVRTGVLPETLRCLLGEDFLLPDLSGPVSSNETDIGVAGYNKQYCRWCNLNDESGSGDGSEPDEEEGEEEDASVDDESD